VYSFALRPEEHQPSGTCNFSRIDNAVLQLVLSSPTVSGTATAKVRVYAVNYNVLRVMSGMAGVALNYGLYINYLLLVCLIQNSAQKMRVQENSGSFLMNFTSTPDLSVSI
jgi:hypothetical protein